MASASNSMYYVESVQIGDQECSCNRCDFVSEWIDKCSEYFTPPNPTEQLKVLLYPFATGGGMPFFYSVDFDVIPEGPYKEYLTNHILTPKESSEQLKSFNVHEWLDKHSQCFPPQKPSVQPMLMLYAHETSGGVPFVYYAEGRMTPRVDFRYISQYIVHRLLLLRQVYEKKPRV